MKWKDSIPPLAPQRLVVRQIKKWAALSWQEPEPAKDGDGASYFVVYRFQGTAKADLSDPSAILSIQKDTSFVDWTAEPGETYLYIVSSVDRLHNESRTCAAVIHGAQSASISSK